MSTIVSFKALGNITAHKKTYRKGEEIEVPASAVKRLVDLGLAPISALEGSEETGPATSKSMTANDAIEVIGGLGSLEDLEAFMAPDEKRATVVRAAEAKSKELTPDEGGGEGGDEDSTEGGE